MGGVNYELNRKRHSLGLSLGFARYNGLQATFGYKFAIVKTEKVNLFLAGYAGQSTGQDGILIEKDSIRYPLKTLSCTKLCPVIGIQTKLGDHFNFFVACGYLFYLNDNRLIFTSNRTSPEVYSKYYQKVNDGISLNIGISTPVDFRNMKRQY